MSYAQTLEELNKIEAEYGYILSDGAAGTRLFEMGLVSGDAPELWNVMDDKKQLIADLCREYCDAGSHIVSTNSFGGNRNRLELHKAGDRVHELNMAAAQIARNVADSYERKILVSGSIGPLGDLLMPNGPVTIEEASDTFYDQAQALADGGVDVILVETMSCVNEAKAAIIGAQRTGLPIIITLTFDTAGKTMMGITPKQAVQDLAHLDNIIAIGLNCGVGPSDSMLSLTDMMTENVPDHIRFMIQSNCGIPKYKDGQFTYSGTPDLMARYAIMAHQAGVRIIGGCCGTHAPIIQNMAKTLDDYQQNKPESQAPIVFNKDQIMAELGEYVNITNDSDDANADKPAKRTRARTRSKS